MWVQNADNQYIDVEKWKKCGSKRKISDFQGQSCWGGLDLSSVGDLTTLSLEFPLENEQIYLYSHSFMPRGRIEEHIASDLAPYDIWGNKGLLTATADLGYYNNLSVLIIKKKQKLLEIGK